MDQNNKLKAILNKIAFALRYRILNETYQFSDDSQIIEPDKILKWLEEFGYTAKYVRSDSFYKLIQKDFDYQFQLISV